MDAMDLLGCDGSALLGASATRTIVDRDVKRPDLSLKAEVFSFIEVSGELGRKCGRVVSCADILVLAARDVVSISGGPYRIPWGRHDGLKVVTMEDLQTSIQPPSTKTDDMISSFVPQELHHYQHGGPLWRAHDRKSPLLILQGRLYPDQDPTMDKRFARYLKTNCPLANSNTTVALNISVYI